MTERTYAIHAVLNLMDAGYTLMWASDGEERIIPTSPHDAIEHTAAAEMGAVRLSRMNGASRENVTLHMLFQGGEPEEVIYDYASNGDLDEIARLIALPRR